MTISATTAWGAAIGTGITGPYAIPFALYNQTDLTVLTVVSNVPTTMALGTDYSFSSFSTDNKGQCASPAITFNATVDGGVLIIFLLAPSGLQDTAITNFSEFFATLHEAEFDQLCQNTLRLLQWAQKSVKAPDFEQAGVANLTLPAIVNRALMVQGFDQNGNVQMYNPFTTPGNSTFLGAISNQASSSAGASDIWVQFVNNKITLTPGTWLIVGNYTIRSKAGTSQLTKFQTIFAAHNGDNTNTYPGTPVCTYQGSQNGLYFQNSDPAVYIYGDFQQMQQMLISVAVNTDIYATINFADHLTDASVQYDFYVSLFAVKVSSLTA